MNATSKTACRPLFAPSGSQKLKILNDVACLTPWERNIGGPRSGGQFLGWQKHQRILPSYLQKKPEMRGFV